MKKLPNFFLIGAPKCGTTAIWHYLRQHPNVFMARKEVEYFATDLFLEHPLKNQPIEAYLDLFAESTDQHLIRGDASAWYLYSSTAVQRIKNFAPNAKFLVMFRNPIQMAYAQFEQNRRGLREDETEFERAWRLQPARARDKRLPNTINNRKPKRFIWQYGDVCKLGQQFQRVLTIVPPKQLHTIIFDDFVADPHMTYNEVLAFLELPNDARTDFPKVNTRTNWRFRTLEKTLLSTLQTQLISSFVQFYINQKKRFGWKDLRLLARVRKFNTRKDTRKPLSPSFEKELKAYFKEDILLLSSLLNRNLTHWYS